MRFKGFLAFFTLTCAIFAASAAPAAMADAGRFVCSTPTDFISPNAQLFSAVDPPTGAPTGLTAVGSSPFVYNALGFDPREGRLYALRQGSNILVRIDRLGAVATLGPVSGLPGHGARWFETGAFDDSLRLWVLAPNHPTTAYAINVETRTVVETLHLSQPMRAWDWTFDNGFMYALNNGTLLQTNLSTGQVLTQSVRALGGPRVNQQFNAAWTFANGDLGFLSAVGGSDDLARITVKPGPLTSPSDIVSVGVFKMPGTSNLIDDGASCVPSDPAITAVGHGVQTAVVGQAVCHGTAVFTDPDTSAVASDYTATIDWGDGTQSTGTISRNNLPAGSFEVSGCHTYTSPGHFTVTTTIVDVDNASNSVVAMRPETVTP